MLVAQSEEIWVEYSVEQDDQDEVRTEWEELPVSVVLSEVLPLHVDDGLDALKLEDL